MSINAFILELYFVRVDYKMVNFMLRLVISCNSIPTPEKHCKINPFLAAHNSYSDDSCSSDKVCDVFEVDSSTSQSLRTTGSLFQLLTTS
jgi:hypothetical protein